MTLHSKQNSRAQIWKGPPIRRMHVQQLQRTRSFPTSLDWQEERINWKSGYGAMRTSTANQSGPYVFAQPVIKTLSNILSSLQARSDTGACLYKRIFKITNEMNNKTHSLSGKSTLKASTRARRKQLFCTSTATDNRRFSVTSMSLASRQPAVVQRIVPSVFYVLQMSFLVHKSSSART